MKNRSIVLIFLICVSMIFSGCSLSNKERNKNQEKEKEINIETKEIKYLLDENKLIKDSGEKEIINEDISSIVGYPDENKEMFSFLLFGYSSKNIFFIKNPQGGGIFYFPVYYLEIENLDKGFKKIEKFLVQTDLKKFKYKDSLKVIGVSSLDVNQLYFVDLEKNIIPEMVYESSRENTFFHPSFHGDDKIDLEWKDENSIEIKEYQINDIKNINPNNSNTFPKGILKTIDLNNPILNISNWQVYRNEEYGFEIKYPKNWITVKRSVNPWDIIGFCQKGVEVSYNQYSQIYIDIKDNPKNFSLKEYYKNLSETSDMLTPDYFKINNVKYLEIDNTESVQFLVIPGAISNTMTSIPYNNQIIEISKHNVEDKSLDKIYDLMLKSIKFLKRR